jgi:hypothetical protein
MQISIQKPFKGNATKRTNGDNLKIIAEYNIWFLVPDHLGCRG